MTNGVETILRTLILDISVLEVAQLFRMDAESIVDEWLAYQSTHGCFLNKDNVEKLLIEVISIHNTLKYFCNLW